ncbi:nuclear envelope protein [Drechmeria coniospora]|uniref:Nuclear envelope protein n=1 Tax=Drechmeria coniospora TaxID=98403 RepID=A0A151GAS1_DRECN|nr:nuclear envelope protein [Drechmeria coniospora]KYK54175.1 nuclear envelope protein [Drechmeria coniospora]
MAAPPARRAPYKDTLQPALHRRFSSTATVLLAVSYLEAVLLASWSSYFWSWFPIGPTGVRTAVIFSCGLAILVLRIAHYHVGLQTTGSGLQTLTSSLLSLKTYEMGFWYGASSLLFCPVFLLSMSDASNLQWITYFGGHRARLNERPLFLLCYLGACALLQTLKHFRHDIDRLDLGPRRGRNGEPAHGTWGMVPKPFRAVLVQLPIILVGCVTQAITATLLSLALYYLFLRSFAWGWALALLRPFFNLPKTSMLPPTLPTDLYLLGRCLYAGMLISLVWSAGNAAFSILMVKEPLKNGKPLTSESKDPNGSVLNGLKSKKLSIQASLDRHHCLSAPARQWLTWKQSFAMWELALIAQDFGTRRQAIYCDIDRKDGSMWAQIYAICMALLKSIEVNVDNYGKPPAVAAVEPAAAPPKQRVSAPPREEPILSQRSPASGLMGGVEKALGQLARAPGPSPVSELSPVAKKTWNSAMDRMLSKERQATLSPGHLKGELDLWTAKLVKIQGAGTLLRQDFRTRFAAAVFDAPYAEPTLYANAGRALCQLAVHSLAEDQFGNVHRDVASIVRTLTSVIRKVDALKARFPMHWTDPSGSRESPEIEYMLDALRTGLGQVVAKFEPYSGDLTLSLGDIRLAKEAAAKPMAPLSEGTPKPTGTSSGTSHAEGSRGEARRLQRREQRPEMEQVRLAVDKVEPHCRRLVPSIPCSHMDNGQRQHGDAARGDGCRGQGTDTGWILPSSSGPNSPRESGFGPALAGT